MNGRQWYRMGEARVRYLTSIGWVSESDLRLVNGWAHEAASCELPVLWLYLRGKRCARRHKVRPQIKELETGRGGGEKITHCSSCLSVCFKYTFKKC